MDRPVLMLDRDGTLNVPATSERYVTRPADIELMPGVAESLVETMVMDPAMVIITNQRGLATGAMTREEYVVVTSALLGLLKQHGISPELIVTCPHDRDACSCRKPSGAMLRAAMQELEAHLRSVCSSETRTATARPPRMRVSSSSGPRTYGFTRTPCDRPWRITAGADTPDGGHGTSRRRCCR